MIGEIIIAGSVLASSGILALTGRSVAKLVTDRLETIATKHGEYIGKPALRVAVATEGMLNEKPVQQENARIDAMNRHLSAAALAVIEGNAPVQDTMREDVAKGVEIGWESAQKIMGDGLRAQPAS